MQRFELLQDVLNLYNSPSYLEVGVQDGFTFHYVTAGRKVAVDPVFRFDVEAASALPINAGSSYQQVPSDEYFSTAGAGEAFDVIYLDGLHTFDQTLRDFINALGVLKPHGTIIVDDTVPSSYGASLTDGDLSLRYRKLREPNEHAWMGDVYRLVFFIQDYCSQLSYATVRENHGQTIVWREQRPAPSGPRTIESISRLEFANAMVNEAAFNMLPFTDIVARLQAQLD